MNRNNATAKRSNYEHAAKLALRTHFLEKYHSGERASVMDCSRGGGRIWVKLCQQFDVSYWESGAKKKIEFQPGFAEDLIDIDTGASPWAHWRAMLPSVTHPVTVFLTATGVIDVACLVEMGLRFSRPVPSGFRERLSDLSVPYCLNVARRHRIRIVEAVEAVTHGNARYFGVRLEPEWHH